MVRLRRLLPSARLGVPVAHPPIHAVFHKALDARILTAGRGRVVTRILTDLGEKNVMGMDPKPARRVKATAGEWAAIRERKLRGWPCRICDDKAAVELHHLVPRGMGGAHGDDVAENLVPVCRVCHGLIEARDPWASSLLGRRLTNAERQYVVGKRGAWYLEKRYGLKEAA